MSRRAGLAFGLFNPKRNSDINALSSRDTFRIIQINGQFLNGQFFKVSTFKSIFNHQHHRLHVHRLGFGDISKNDYRLCRYIDARI